MALSQSTIRRIELKLKTIREWANRIGDECYIEGESYAIVDTESYFDVDKCYELLCELVAKGEVLES